MALSINDLGTNIIFQSEGDTITGILRTYFNYPEQRDNLAGEVEGQYEPIWTAGYKLITVDIDIDNAIKDNAIFSDKSGLLEFDIDGESYAIQSIDGSQSSRKAVITLISRQGSTNINDGSNIFLTLKGQVIDGLIVGDKIDIEPVTLFKEKFADGLNASTAGLISRTIRIPRRTDVRVSSTEYYQIRQLKFRVRLYSPADVLLNGWIESEDLDDLIVNEAVVIETTPDAIETFTFGGGSFTNQPQFFKDEKTGIKVVEYTIEFLNSSRVIRLTNIPEPPPIRPPVIPPEPPVNPPPVKPINPPVNPPVNPPPVVPPEPVDNLGDYANLVFGRSGTLTNVPITHIDGGTTRWDFELYHRDGKDTTPPYRGMDGNYDTSFETISSTTDTKYWAIRATKTGEGSDKRLTLTGFKLTEGRGEFKNGGVRLIASVSGSTPENGVITTVYNHAQNALAQYTVRVYGEDDIEQQDFKNLFFMSEYVRLFSATGWPDVLRNKVFYMAEFLPRLIDKNPRDTNPVEPSTPITIENSTFSIRENNNANAIIGKVITTGYPTEYQIVSGGDGIFFIDNQGVITIPDENALNLQTTPTYTLTVGIARETGDGVTGTITVNVTEAVHLGDYPDLVFEHSDRGYKADVAIATPDGGTSNWTFVISATREGVDGGSYTGAIDGDPNTKYESQQDGHQDKYWKMTATKRGNSLAKLTITGFKFREPEDTTFVSGGLNLISTELYAGGIPPNPDVVYSGGLIGTNYDRHSTFIEYDEHIVTEQDFRSIYFTSRFTDVHIHGGASTFRIIRIAEFLPRLIDRN